jgi:toxin ParE1/3/4
VRTMVLLASVRADLVAIKMYIARASGSVAVADQFVAELREQCRKLAALPGTLGRTRPELGTGLRSRSYRGYVIFFRYGSDRIEIIDILEGHLDIGTFFGQEPDA